jgi:hypothetical protein
MGPLKDDQNLQLDSRFLRCRIVRTLQALFHTPEQRDCWRTLLALCTQATIDVGITPDKRLTHWIHPPQ